MSLPRKGPPAVERTTSAVDPAAALRLLDGYSLEMTGKDVPGLEEARHAIPAGTKINVTFLGNEDLDMRVAAAKAVKDLGFVPVPHISARRLTSQGQLEEFLGRLQEVGATEHVFSVGGDPTEPEGPYADSLVGDPHRPAAEVRRARGLDRRLPRGPPRHRDRRALAASGGQVGRAAGAGAGCRHPDPVRVRHRSGDGVDQGGARARHRHADPRRHAWARRDQATAGLRPPLRHRCERDDREEVRVLADEPHGHGGSRPVRGRPVGALAGLRADPAAQAMCGCTSTRSADCSRRPNGRASSPPPRH